MYIKLTLESFKSYSSRGQAMSYFYSIFSIAIVSSSLFAMDNKSGPSNSKNPMSCHMKSELWGGYVDKETGATHVTYKYHDGSKSTYTTYNDSSSKKK